MREPKNQMLGTMEPPLMQLSVKIIHTPHVEDFWKCSHGCLKWLFIDFFLKNVTFYFTKKLETRCK